MLVAICPLPELVTPVIELVSHISVQIVDPRCIFEVDCPQSFRLDSLY